MDEQENFLSQLEELKSILGKVMRGISEGIAKGAAFDAGQPLTPPEEAASPPPLESPPPLFVSSPSVDPLDNLGAIEFAVPPTSPEPLDAPRFPPDPLIAMPPVMEREPELTPPTIPAPQFAEFRPAPPPTTALDSPTPTELPPPLTPPEPMQDLRHGFMAGGGFAYGNEVAEAQLYDQNTDNLFQVTMDTHRLEGEYRRSQLEWARRASRDLNADYREQEELTRGYELSRETITDANI